MLCTVLHSAHKFENTYFSTTKFLIKKKLFLYLYKKKYIIKFIYMSIFTKKNQEKPINWKFYLPLKVNFFTKKICC